MHRHVVKNQFSAFTTNHASKSLFRVLCQRRSEEKSMGDLLSTVECATYMGLSPIPSYCLNYMLNIRVRKCGDSSHQSLKK